LSSLKQVKKLLVSWMSHKVLKSLEPNVDPSLNRQILSDARNNDLATIARSDIFEFGVLSEKHNILGGQPLANF